MELTTLTDKLPRYFNDSQNLELERNPLYTRMGGKCPVCRGTNEYRYNGETHECPDDDFGHPMTRLFKLYCLANLPLEYQSLVWEHYPHDEWKDKADRYVENYESARIAGVGWHVSGKRLGVGKTWLAVHILKQVLLMGYTGWFIPFMSLKGLFEMDDAAERDRILRKVMDSEFVVIDDVLKPKSNAARALFEDKLEEVVRHRTSNNLPTATTTNMEEQMEAEFPRVSSLLSAKQFMVALTGTDYRQDAAWVSNEELVLNGEVRPLTW